MVTDMNDVTSMHAQRTAMGPAAEVSGLAVCGQRCAAVPDRTGSLSFGAALPSAGRYRLFPQSQHRGLVQTVALTLEAPVTESIDMGHSSR